MIPLWEPIVERFKNEDGKYLNYLEITDEVKPAEIRARYKSYFIWKKTRGRYHAIT